VRQNLFWAFAYNVVGITLAMAGVLNPILAAAAMVLSSLSVIGNSDGTVLIERRGAHLQDLARQFNPVAALHQEDAAHGERDDREANAERHQKVFCMFRPRERSS
jgi:hypothetical protein